MVLFALRKLVATSTTLGRRGMISMCSENTAYLLAWIRAIALSRFVLFWSHILLASARSSLHFVMGEAKWLPSAV